MTDLFIRLLLMMVSISLITANLSVRKKDPMKQVKAKILVASRTFSSLLLILLVLAFIMAAFKYLTQLFA